MATRCAPSMRSRNCGPTLSPARCAPGRSARTPAKRYSGSLKQVGEFLTGRLSQLDRQLIAQIIRARLAQGAANATIKRDLNALSSVLNDESD